MHFCTALDVSLTFSYISSIFKNGTPGKANLSPENVGSPRIIVILFGTYSGLFHKPRKMPRFIVNRGFVAIKYGALPGGGRSSAADPAHPQ